MHDLTQMHLWTLSQMQSSSSKCLVSGKLQAEARAKVQGLQNPSVRVRRL